MLTVIAYYKGDQDQALRLAQWINEMGGCKSHRLLIVQDTSVTDGERITALFRQAFDSVEILSFVDHFHQWPHSCNHLWSTAARHIESNKPEPWLWIEPDVVPLVPNWIDLIAAEYAEAGKPFLGDFVNVDEVPPHMSGVAVYPGQITRYAGLALIANDVAWDCAAAEQIVPKMHTSKHILHAWRHPSFQHWSEVEKQVFAFKPECCLFHADKSSSLIDLLRARQSPSKRLGIAAADTVKQGNDAHSPAGVASGSSGPFIYEFKDGRLVTCA